MKLFGRELTGFPKALAVLAAVLLVSTGLCGMQLIIANGTKSSASILMPLGIAELAAILLSALGIMVVLIAWLVSALYHRVGTRRPDDSDDH